MTVEQIEFFLETTTHCAVFGRGDSFISIPLGCGETPSLEVIVDAAVRGFALCGIVGLCEDRNGIREWVNAETLGAAFTVQLARSRYFAWLRNRDKAVCELDSLYTLQDTRCI